LTKFFNQNSCSRIIIAIFCVK